MNFKEAGKHLKKLRNEKGLAIEYISREIKVSKEKLKAIEEGNMESFSSRFYAKSFLKDYSEYLGSDLDVSQVIPNKREEPISPEVKLAPTDRPRPRIRKSSSKRIAVAVLTLIFSALTLFALFLAYERITGRVRVAEHEDELHNYYAAEEEKITVRASAAGNVWLRVERDDVLAYEGVLSTGTTRDWEADSKMRIRIGYVPGLDLYWRTRDDEDFQKVDIVRGSVNELNEIKFDLSSEEKYSSTFR